MSTWNISSNAASNYAKGILSGADNDVGTIRGAGNVASSRFVKDALTLGRSEVITIVSGVNGVREVNGTGGREFNGGDQVIRKVTNDIAGASNTVLLTGGSNSANRPFSIKQVAAASSHQYKTAVRTGGWQEYSGVFSPAVKVVSSGFWSQATDTDTSSVIKSSGVDNAANPTKTVPGELVYRQGGKLPKQDDYKAKTVF